MQMTSTGSPATSKRLNALLDVMLDMATALGTVREHQRLMEARVAQHDASLASAEASIHSLRTTIATWTASTPTAPAAPSTMATTTQTSTSPTSTATPATDTAAVTKAILKRTAPKLFKYGLRELAPWLLGRIVMWALPYLLAASGLLLVWGQTALRWLSMIWRALIG